MNKIKSIKAKEIKDSRGNPTIEVELITEKGSFMASCPSGASTGKNEALELRDADGKGVSTAINNVNKIISPNLTGRNPEDQKELDDLMIELDSTENKSKLGANAILPVSIAICRAAAESEKLPLYQYIAQLSESKNLHIPFASFNFIEGGAHAVGRNNLDTQEFMVVPQKKTFTENLMIANTIFGNLKETLTKNYGADLKMGDEGGFAPQISKTEQALLLLKSAIGNLGVKIAIDCAASQFFKGGKYFLEGKEFSRNNLIDFYRDLVSRFEIISIEDPFAEEDWQSFQEISKELSRSENNGRSLTKSGSEIIIVGDDLTTTNIKRIKEAKNKEACNGIIIKPNQIGTVSEAIEAAKLAKSYNWKIIVSHRAGETADTFIADLSVGVRADFIKSGSPSQTERMLKYNRLLEIGKELAIK